MAEQFVNKQTYLLQTICLATDTTLTLQGVFGLPTGGTFRMRMGAEILEVTAVNSSTNQLTVVRGTENTVARGQPIGTPLIPELTAAGMAQFKADVLTFTGNTTQPTWYVDPANSSGLASDSNTGFDATHPLLTFGALFVRLGTQGGFTQVIPNGITVTVTQMSDQTKGVDSYSIDPTIFDGGGLAIVAANPQRGTNFSPTTVTAAIKDSSGTLLKLNGNLPAGTASGDIVKNVTKGSSALVISVAAGNATMSQPFANTSAAAFPTLTQDNTWTSTDTYQVLRPLNSNAIGIQGNGGQVDANASVGPYVWLQGMRVLDNSGSFSSSGFAMQGTGCANCYAYLCNFEPFFEMNNDLGNAGGVFNCGMVLIPGASNVQPAFLVGSGTWMAGFVTDLTCVNGSNRVDGDVVILDALFVAGPDTTVNGCALMGANTTLYSGGSVLQGQVKTQASGVVWGPGTINLASNSWWVNAFNGTWVNALKVATLQMSSLSVGWAQAANGITYGPIPLTPANLDANSSLSNPTNVSAFITGGDQAVAVPTTWSQGTWYWDPANSSGHASDNNDGKTSGAPLLTWAGFLSKMGTDRPRIAYGTSLTINKMSAQAANVDAVSFEPLLSGGGQLALVDALTVKSASFTSGTVTAKNQATGTRLQVAGMPVGTAAGDYLWNSTRNSYAIVDSMASQVATVSQPLSAASVTTIAAVPTFAQDNTWTTGDSITVYSRNLTNLKRFCNRGGDVSGTSGGTWVQWTIVQDASGAGTAEYPASCEGASLTFVGCQINPRLHMSANQGRGNPVTMMGCDIVGAVVAYSGNNLLFGNVVRGTFTQLSGQTGVDGSNYCHGATNFIGGIVAWSDGYADALVTVNEGGYLRLGSGVVGGGTTAFWGTAGIRNVLGSQVVMNSGTWTTVCLTSGALDFGSGLTTGFSASVNGTFTANGSTQVDVAPSGGQHFPATAPIAFGMSSVSGTPGAIFFSANQAADAFHVKSTSSTDASTYNWTAAGAAVTVNVSNLDLYKCLRDPNSGAQFVTVG